MVLSGAPGNNIKKTDTSRCQSEGVGSSPSGGAENQSLKKSPLGDFFIFASKFPANGRSGLKVSREL
jgi:hypothetical protein